MHWQQCSQAGRQGMLTHRAVLECITSAVLFPSPVPAAERAVSFPYTQHLSGSLSVKPCQLHQPVKAYRKNKFVIGKVQKNYYFHARLQ